MLDVIITITLTVWGWKWPGCDFCLRDDALLLAHDTLTTKVLPHIQKLHRIGWGTVASKTDEFTSFLDYRFTRNGCGSDSKWLFSCIFFQSQNTRQHEKQKYLRDWQYLNQHSKMEKQLLLQNFCRISLKSHSSGLDSHPTTLRFSLPSLDVITSGFPFESCRYRYYILTNINNTYSFSYKYVLLSVSSFSHLYIHIYLLLNLVFFVSPKTSPWMKPRAQWSPWHEDHKDSTMRDAPLKSSRVQSCSPSAAVDPRCILLHTCGV